ncbi:MAG: phosphotransacetylase family protein [Dissulfurispiraceae bacterium]
MIPVLVASNTPFCGKAFITLGLALNLKEQGYKVGFIKPFGKMPVKKGREVFDEDAIFIKETVGLPEPYAIVSPFVLGFEMQTLMLEGRAEGVKKKVMAAFDSLRDKDIVIIIGPHDLFEGSLLNINVLSLMEDMNAHVLMVEQWRGFISLDSLFGAYQLIKERFLGGVINKVPGNVIPYLKETIGPFLENRGIRIFGTFQKDKLLESVTVRHLAEVLKGNILCCEDKIDEFVDNFLIGAMDVDSALSYFMRTPNKAVITGVYRTDIQLAAIETSTKCIILTGGLHPTDVVMGKARIKGIPLISAPGDTFTTVDKIESIMGRTIIRDQRKADRARELVQNEFDMSRLLALLKTPV